MMSKCYQTVYNQINNMLDKQIQSKKLAVSLDLQVKRYEYFASIPQYKHDMIAQK